MSYMFPARLKAKYQSSTAADFYQLFPSIETIYDFALMLESLWKLYLCLRHKVSHFSLVD